MPPKKQDSISRLAQQGFDVQYLSHAQSILTGEFAPQLQELAGVLAASHPADEGFASFDARFVKRARKHWLGISIRTP